MSLVLGLRRRRRYTHASKQSSPLTHLPPNAKDVFSVFGDVVKSSDTKQVEKTSTKTTEKGTFVCAKTGHMGFKKEKEQSSVRYGQEWQNKDTSVTRDQEYVGTAGTDRYNHSTPEHEELVLTPPAYSECDIQGRIDEAQHPENHPPAYI